MKKWIAIILALAMVLSMAACGSEDSTAKRKEAFEASKVAFDKVNEAYVMVNEYSQDIYEAWRLGVNKKSDYDDDYEFSDFVDELHIEQVYVEQAVAKLLDKDTFAYGDWETLQWFYSNFFSACVSAVSEAYVCSGAVDEISELLIDAKTNMKQLSDEYSDYEHYPALKSYFTNTLAFFDFCQNPEGSFEQVIETFNTYRNNAREYFFELNYVFEDSIGGMDEILEDAESTEETVTTEPSAE